MTILAVTLATFLGGQRYFYCRPMNRIVANTNCPCARAADDASNVPLARVVNDCFELRVLDRLASFAIGCDLSVPPATLTARLPLAHLTGLPEGAISGSEHPPIRAGPYSPAGLRSRLMVFLI